MIARMPPLWMFAAAQPQKPEPKEEKVTLEMADGSVDAIPFSHSRRVNLETAAAVKWPIDVKNPAGGGIAVTETRLRWGSFSFGPPEQEIKVNLGVQDLFIGNKLQSSTLVIDSDGNGFFDDAPPAAPKLGKSARGGERQDWHVPVVINGRTYPLHLFRFTDDEQVTQLSYEPEYRMKGFIIERLEGGKEVRHEINLFDTAATGNFQFPLRPMTSEQFMYDFGFGEYGPLTQPLVERIWDGRAQKKSWDEIVKSFEDDAKVTAEQLDALKRNLRYDWKIFGHIPADIFARIRKDLQTDTFDKVFERYKTDPAITPEMLNLIEQNFRQNDLRIRPVFAVDTTGKGELDASGDYRDDFQIGNLKYMWKNVSPSGEEAVFTVTPVEAAAPAVDDKHLHKDMLAPAITGTVFAGPKTGEKLTVGGDSKDFQGKIVVVDFWATWCGPCLASFPHVRELQKHFAEQPVAIVGVSQDEKLDDEYVAKKMQATHMGLSGTDARALTPAQTAERFKAFLEQNPTTGQIYYMIDREMIGRTKWGINGIPDIFILDGDTGKVLAEGEQLRNPETLQKTIEAELAKRK